MDVGAKMAVLCLFIFKVCIAGLGAIKHTHSQILQSVSFFFFFHARSTRGSFSSVITCSPDTCLC